MDQLLPRYVRVYRSLRERILSNELKPGHQLPPQHILASQYGVAFATLARSLGILEEEGLVSRKHGLGTFIADPKERAAHVLVVDDEAPAREMLASIIQDSGFIVIAVDSGETALVELQKRRFTHVFTDLRLAGVGGAQLVTRIFEGSPDTAVVVVSAYPQDLEELASRDALPVIVIRKPFRPSQVRQALRLEGGVREGAEIASASGS